MSIEDIVSRYVAAINCHDPDAIAELLTENHRSIDSGGAVFTGREVMRQAWLGYFNMVLDYSISVSEVFTGKNTVAMFGMASGTYTSDGTISPENYWETPAAWRAVVDHGKISEWQVFADLEPLREIIRKDSLA